MAKRVVVVEGEDAAPEAVLPSVEVLRGLGLDVEWVWPDVEDMEATRRAIDGSDATLFGAASGRSRWVLRYLRWGKQTYANVRPIRWLPGFKSPLVRPEGIDFVIVRENLEDLYVGMEGELSLLEGLTLPASPGRPGLPVGEKGGFAIKVITEKGAARVARFAFELARRRKDAGFAGKVTCATKRTVLPLTDGLFAAVAEGVAGDYPDVKFEHFNVDDLGRRIVASPKELDVVLLPNQYGDILSDVAAGVIGGLGLAPSGCYGEAYAYFEPTHGTAPDIAGKNIINPTATLLSAAMMLDYLGFTDAARRLEAAVARVYAEGRRLTPDQGGNASATEFCEAVAAYL
jgi:isocitrate/isopropylmalate dehydrogenase